MRARIVNWLVGGTLAVTGLCLFAGFWGAVAPNAAGRLIFGWLAFLDDVLPRVEVNWDGVATVAVCLLLIFLGSHAFVRWLYAARSNAESKASGSWKMRWSAMLVALVVLMFVTGTAFIGVVHQVGWLASSRGKLTTYHLKLGPYHSQLNQLNEIGIGFHRYHEFYKELPPNGVDVRNHPANHSWQTRLLAGLMYDLQRSLVRMDLDWDHPENVPAFQRFVPEYLNPDIGEVREARGLAVSHYAGNVRVFDRPRPLTLADASRSNRILAGECAANFKAWGDPANLRDPARGINQEADGFGSPTAKGAQFVMLDGSVRFLSSAIDRQVLAALATPDAGHSLALDGKVDAPPVKRDQ